MTWEQGAYSLAPELFAGLSLSVDIAFFCLFLEAKIAPNKEAPHRRVSQFSLVAFISKEIKTLSVSIVFSFEW